MDEVTEELRKLRLALWARYPEAMECPAGWRPSDDRLLDDVRLRLKSDCDESRSQCKISDVSQGYFSLCMARTDKIHERCQGQFAYCVSLNYRDRSPKWTVGLYWIEGAAQNDVCALKNAIQSDESLSCLCPAKGKQEKRRWACHLGEKALLAG